MSVDRIPNIVYIDNHKVEVSLPDPKQLQELPTVTLGSLRNGAGYEHFAHPVNGAILLVETDSTGSRHLSVGSDANFTNQDREVLVLTQDTPRFPKGSGRWTWELVPPENFRTGEYYTHSVHYGLQGIPPSPVTLRTIFKIRELKQESILFAFAQFGPGNGKNLPRCTVRTFIGNVAINSK